MIIGFFNDCFNDHRHEVTGDVNACNSSSTESKFIRVERDDNNGDDVVVVVDNDDDTDDVRSHDR